MLLTTNISPQHLLFFLISLCILILFIGYVAYHIKRVPVLPKEAGTKQIFQYASFNLEYQYAQFLKRMELREEDMGKVQRIETKRTFMAASSQILILLRDELPEDEEKAVELMQNLHSQCTQFWMKEVGLVAE